MTSLPQKWFHNQTCQQLDTLYRYTLMFTLYMKKWIDPYLAYNMETYIICISNHCDHSLIYFIQKCIHVLTTIVYCRFSQKTVHSHQPDCETTPPHPTKLFYKLHTVYMYTGSLCTVAFPRKQYRVANLIVKPLLGSGTSGGSTCLGADRTSTQPHTHL